MDRPAEQKINLTAIEYRATPFEAFGRLRQMGTLVPAHLPVFGKMWLVTTYEAVDEVLKNEIPGAVGQPHTRLRHAGHFVTEDRTERLVKVLCRYIRS